MRLAILAGSAISATIMIVSAPAWADCHTQIRDACCVLNGYPDGNVPDAVLAKCIMQAKETCSESADIRERSGMDYAVAAAGPQPNGPVQARPAHQPEPQLDQAPTRAASENPPLKTTRGTGAMTTRFAARPTGLLAAAAIAAAVAIPQASAAETELLVIVTPRLNPPPPPENQGNVELRGFGAFSVKKRQATTGTQGGTNRQQMPSQPIRAR